MTDKEKKAIDDLFSLTHINGYINLYDQKKANIYTSDLKRWQNGVKVLLNLIQTQQEEIEKKDKVIDLILEKQAGSSCLNIYCKKRNKKDKCLECVKEYFINKVEKESKDG